jgi:hypothetical protein
MINSHEFILLDDILWLSLQKFIVDFDHFTTEKWSDNNLFICSRDMGRPMNDRDNMRGPPFRPDDRFGDFRDDRGFVHDRE